MIQSQRTLQEYRCTLPPSEVLARAKQFFSQRNSLYASFLDTEGPSHVTFRGQGGEELVIAATVQDGVTRVTGSTYLFDMQISRFFTTLPSLAGGDALLPALPART
ncbi:MAG: hypothetical protein LH467_10035 [Gemmatimonadaceae bacterium]|nr:hypothetical protein [Gemmatimonadaceae bacterium]